MLRKYANGILYQPNEAESDDENETKRGRVVYERFIVLLGLFAPEAVIFLDLLVKISTHVWEMWGH